jgi:peptidoglycan/xylan/chitin deacetylase (PgdA/CDA1 family)
MGLSRRNMTATHVNRKQGIKNAVYGLLGGASYCSGLTWVRNAIDAAPSLRILIYYKVNSVPGNTLSTTPQLFARQMRFLKEHYTVISPEQLTGVVRYGTTLPHNAVLLTFDDGYRDVYDNAYPILKELGLKALISPAVDYIGTGRPFPHDKQLPMPNPALNWTHLRTMQDVFTIGSHAQSHRVLTRVPLHVAKEEISTSKKILEDRLGCAVEFFTYPHGGAGEFSRPLEDIVRAAGYIASFVTLTGPNTLKHVRSGKWLRRYHVEPHGDFMFARLLDGSCDAIGLKDTRWGSFVKRTFNRLLGTQSPQVLAFIVAIRTQWRATAELLLS